ncbi:hypothetical protein Hypma_001123 [Hypsizygus marmoreus]|uniref:Uncharacterized protein n=1 Tax=Hypsizygus marmoreus TaxID=39966 RepID=A0A369JCZ4_HYPMA|nr:hypothetical protein Hypma_001123 [Hypsizygus marmoreus]
MVYALQFICQLQQRSLRTSCVRPLPVHTITDYYTMPDEHCYQHVTDVIPAQKSNNIFSLFPSEDDDHKTDKRLLPSLRTASEESGAHLSRMNRLLIQM